MPNVRMPDGVTIKNVPEGMTKKELLRRYSKMKSGDPNPVRRKPAIDPSTTFGKSVIGLGSGLTRFGQSAAQLAIQGAEAIGLADEGAGKQYTESVDQERAFYEETPVAKSTAGQVSQFLGEMAPTLVAGGGVAGGVTKLATVGRLGNAVNTAMTGANKTGMAARAITNAAGGAAGGASVFVPEGESRAKNAAVGASMAVVLAPAISAITRRISNIRGVRSAKKAAAKRAEIARQELAGTMPDQDITRIADDIADGLTPEQAMRKYDIETMGATPTAGRVSGNVDDLFFEQEQIRSPTRVPGIERNISDIDQQNRQVFTDQIDGRVHRMTGGADAEHVGDTALQSLSEAKKAAQEVTTGAYNEAGERLNQLGGGGTGSSIILPDSATSKAAPVIRPSKLMETLSDEADFLDTPDLIPVMSALRRTGLLDTDEIASMAFGTARRGPNNVLTPKRAESIRKTLSTLTQSKKPDTRRVATKLLKSLENDVVRDVGEDIFAAARQTSHELVQEPFNNNVLVSELLNGTINPESVHRKLMQPSTSIKNVKSFFRTVEDISIDSANQIKGLALKEIFQSVRGARDAQGVPFMNPQSLNKKIEQIGEPKLRAIFGEDGLNDIRQVNRMAHLLFNVDRRVANPGTASALSRRIEAMSSAAGKIAEKFPMGGQLFMGILRASKNANLNKGVERRIRRAMNLEILKREQLLGEFAAPRPAPVVSAGIGSASAEE